ncbi:uncharacterized protein LOC129100217 isoform X2 [Anoplopoma fimbria]|uniref:uncharacterized protein LOC129100217 isoform X2 n=1 Tax=Anoplopoma fimbria TaxID=229290 RepID=UPI0023EC3908|nr:uncharacterized protein LOC129100217 isoform X2 [Anoplopoma fimbria]
MNVCHILICFVLTLQGGNTLQDGILKVPEGGNITRGCSFTFSGDTPNTSKPNWTLRPSTSSATTHSLSSSSGSFKSSSASPETTTQSVQQLERTAAPPAPSGKLLLYVGLILAVIILLLSLAVLFFFCRRTSEPKELHVETEYASVSGANREDIREDGQSRSPPVEMSSVYSYAKYTEPNRAESDDCSLITAATSQHKAADDLKELTYSQVDFQGVHSASLNGALTNDVTYSMLQVEASSEDASPPLYSALTLPQQ